MLTPREPVTEMASRTGLIPILPITASREQAHRVQIEALFRAELLRRTEHTLSPAAPHSEPAPTILRAARNKEAVLLTVVQAVRAEAAVPTPVRAPQEAAVRTAVRAAPPEAIAPAVHPAAAVDPLTVPAVHPAAAADPQ